MTRRKKQVQKAETDDLRGLDLEMRAPALPSARAAPSGPADKPIVRILTTGAENAVQKAIDDPIGSLANVDAAAGLLIKMLPTLPGESVIPMPRGVYDKLREQQGAKRP